MRLNLFFSIICAFICEILYAEAIDMSLKPYRAHEWQDTESKSFLYRTASPEKMKKEKTYPMLVFFHGAGGRGSDNKGQLLDAGGLQAFEKA